LCRAHAHAAPGEAAAAARLAHFAAQGLAAYDTARNDPSQNGQSGLSPYLHFGQLCAARAATAALHAAADGRGVSRQAADAFIEELIVRRELSDNFVANHPDYDTTACFPDWARRTLARHAADQRPWLYGRAQLEEARTHDPAWNAAQTEMLLTGKMHGYMRMYWAKKILEWTPGPHEALRLAILLNDRYELDGRDTNGYVGVAWSIGGVHDRAWRERPVFGKVRYMSAGGLERKGKPDQYVEKVERLKRRLSDLHDTNASVLMRWEFSITSD